MPIVYTAYDYNSSVGEGGNCAIPGSDVDTLFFFTEGPVNPARIEDFRRLLFPPDKTPRINPLITSVTEWDVTTGSFLTLAHIARYPEIDFSQPAQTENDRKIRENNWVFIQQIVYGSKLYEKKSQYLRAIRSSLSGITVPRPHHKNDDFNRTKYAVRRKLSKEFGELRVMLPKDGLAFQYALVRTQLQYSLDAPRIPDPVDFKLVGKDFQLLSQLTKLGYFFIEDNQFVPGWIYNKRNKSALT